LLNLSIASFAFPYEAVRGEVRLARRVEGIILYSGLRAGTVFQQEIMDPNNSMTLLYVSEERKEMEG
jgi:hypothetical protein